MAVFSLTALVWGDKSWGVGITPWPGWKNAGVLFPVWRAKYEAIERPCMGEAIIRAVVTLWPYGEHV